MLSFQAFLPTMFSSTGLFKQVQCPEQSHCSFSNCIFSHHPPSIIGTVAEHNSSPPKTNVSASINAANVCSEATKASRSPLPTEGEDDELLNGQDVPRKRRRISADNDSGSDKIVQSVVPEGPRRQPLASQPARAETGPPRLPRLPSTAVREVSPPPPRALKTKAAAHLLAKAETASKLKSSKESKLTGHATIPKESIEKYLNPRLIRNPPASHGVRMQLIKMLHEQMGRLNEEVSQSQDPSKSALRLSPQELIWEALEEEETIAIQNSAVYLNIIKLRITKLKKMGLSEWKDDRLKQIAKRAPLQTGLELKVTKSISTNLSTTQEIAFLSRLFAKQDQLAGFGYVPKPPSDQDVAKARAGVEAGQGWEQCDRCKTRFQVFHGRREEDGALTSGGSCSYHPAKPRRPLEKDRSDKGFRESIYACCNEAVGTSVGCTTAPTHVFKVSDSKRLALIIPFKETPTKVSSSPAPITAVCFDCEMGYTTIGLEIIRLTATSWPGGEELLDTLIRPLGEVLDLNSRFSGVWPTDFSRAFPYGSGGDTDINGARSPSAKLLPLVESPSIARDLLFHHLTPDTPLIGHALDNDLNAIRIIHPSIVDSVLLYPHPRGLPVRFGLKMLMKRHLDRDIQMGGANGHDSKEDARAAGDLVRLKVAEMWKTMQKDGWTVKDSEFCPPLWLAPTALDIPQSSNDEAKT